MALIHIEVYFTSNNYKYTAKGRETCVRMFRRYAAHVCFVSGCSNHSNCDTNWNHHCLPLKNKPWLCLWIHELGRSNLPLKLNTHACSDHFVNSCGLELRVDKNPTLRLPKLSTSWMLPKKRKAPRLPKLSTSRTSLKKTKAPTTCNTNEGEQSLPVSERDVDCSIVAKSNILESGDQVGSSYK